MDSRLQTELTEEDIKAMYDRMKASGSFDAPQDSDPQPVITAPDDEELVDNYGFPFEPESIYNSAMLDFEEVAGVLWGLILQTHYCATRYHRLSPNYTLLMQHLEKDIRQMGSYCITQAVLEQTGQEFTLLKGAELKELSSMVSLHFRKCWRAYNDIYSDSQCTDMNMVNWMFRWAGLFERLKATQDKINKIKSGKIKVETLLDTQNVYKGEPNMRKDRSEKAVEPRLRTSSMPIIKSYAKEVRLQQKAEEKKERALKREAERAKKSYQRELNRIRSNDIDGKIIPPMPLPKIPEIGLNEKELRKLLMDEAKSRMDMAEAGIIARESLEELVERFYRNSGFGCQVSGIRNREGPRSGPSDETRKKLREKRKKRR
jgi:hypothetical protein